MLNRDCTGTHSHRNSVDNGRIQRARAEKYQDHRDRERRQHRGTRSEKTQHGWGYRKRRRPRRDQVQRAMIGPQPAVGNPAAERGAAKPANRRDPPKRDANRRRRESTTLQERGHPRRDSTQRKGHHCHAQSRVHVARIRWRVADNQCHALYQLLHKARLRSDSLSRLTSLAGTAHWLAQKEDHQQRNRQLRGRRRHRTACASRSSSQ